MAKRKKAQPWDAVFDRVRVGRHADRRATPKPTPAELDAVEAQLGIQFPLSYRAFTERFGLGGSLRGHGQAELFLLNPPPDNEWPHHRDSVVEDTAQSRSYSRENYEGYGEQHPTVQFEQLVQFGGGEDYSFLFNPGEVTDGQSRECRVYSLNSDGGLMPRADSFTEWLVWANECFVSPAEEFAHYPVAFQPDPSASNAIPYFADSGDLKVPPAEGDVGHWLAFNNNTARDLAYSIRDRGQTDAFPILADALQEAGCANADLLDSCRTGDPHIDGAWVLQVLMGKT
jgi:hypothetical protein